MDMIHKAFKYRVYPTKQQAQAERRRKELLDSVTSPSPAALR